MYKKLWIVACLCVISFGLPALANCGSCGTDSHGDGEHANGEKAACPSDCQKACCQKESNGNGNGEELHACCQAAIAEGKAPCCVVLSGKDHKCPAEGKCPGKAPDFTLSDQNGKEVKLSDLIGKKIVVLEWVNWDCPFVVPHYTNKTYTKLTDKYTGMDPQTNEEREVVWLTINSTHYATTEDNKSKANEFNLDHLVLSDPTGEVGHLYKATNTPHLYIIDKTGHIAYQGAIDNAPRGNMPEGKKYVNYVDAALAELTAGKDVTGAYTKAYGCTVKYPPREQVASGG